MTFTLPNHTQAEAQTLVPGLTMEWLEAGGIVAFTLTSSSYQVVEAYFEANMQLMDEAEKTPQNLMIMLHDISHKDMSLTPMLRNRLDEVAQRIRKGQVQYRSAVIMSNTPMSMVFSFFGNVFSRSARNTVQRFFTSRQSGVEWLKQYIGKTAER